MVYFRKSFIALLLLAAIALISACTPGTGSSEPEPDEGKLQIYFINVGKGDAALLGTPDGKWIMIDVGRAHEFAHVGRILKQNDVTQLEAIFISHPHNDHFSALADLLSHVSCKVIYTTPHLEEFKHEQRFLDMAEAADVPVEALYAGDTLDIAGISIDILGPNGVFEEEDDNSLVQMVTWDRYSVLFTGDQRYAAEKALLKTGQDLSSDVLKAGNHGRNASSEEFLQAVQAQYAIVTNDFKGKEYEESVSHFASFDMRVYVLGETGTMLCELGEGAVNFYAVKPPYDAPVPDIVIGELRRNQAAATIKNRANEEIALKGWSLVSNKDKHTYFFSDSSVISPGQTLTVLHDMFGAIKNKDTLVLYDQYGRAVDSAS